MPSAHYSPPAASSCRFMRQPGERKNENKDDLLTFVSHNIGILYLLYCCVNMLFWRVFMRISYTCPEHIKLALTVQKWTDLVQLTGNAIDWLDHNERAYDVWMLVSYCSTLCAFVQVRRRSAAACGECDRLLN